MSVPDFQTLMLPALAAIVAAEKITSAELRGKVAEFFELSADDLAEMQPSGRAPMFANRLAWANIHLQRAKLVEVVRRGTYRATPRGREVIATAPVRVDMKFLERFPEYNEWRHASRQGTSGEISSETSSDGSGSIPPIETVGRAIEIINAELRASLLERVRSMNTVAFERLILALLVAMGYGGGQPAMALQTPRSNDDGIDGVIKEDALGLERVMIQAKRYAPANAVGRPDIQGFVGSLAGNGTSKGIFVTTSTFTIGAREYVARIPNRVILIDGEELARLMIRYDVGVRVTQTFAVKDIDENVFEDS